MTSEEEQAAIKFAPILKQVAQEMGFQVMFPDEPKRTYAEFPATKSWEELADLRKRANSRIRELRTQAEIESTFQDMNHANDCTLIFNDDEYQSGEVHRKSDDALLCAWASADVAETIITLFMDAHFEMEHPRPTPNWENKEVTA